MKWQKVRRIPNAKGAMKSTNIEEETMSYEATVYEYRDVQFKLQTCNIWWALASMIL